MARRSLGRRGQHRPDPTLTGASPAVHGREEVNDQLLMAQAVVRYAVTKRENWELLIEFLTERLDGVQLDEHGRIPRGGPGQWWKPYSERDYEIADRISALNRRQTSEEFPRVRRTLTNPKRRGPDQPHPVG